MKIIDHETEELVAFEDLEPGDVFKLQDDNNFRYLKVKSDNPEFNCVFINDMDLDYVVGSCQVIPIKSTLILGEEK